MKKWRIILASLLALGCLSLAAGAQKVPDVRVNTNAAGASTCTGCQVASAGSVVHVVWADSRSPQIAAPGNPVFVVWKDSRNGSPDIYFNTPFGFFQSYGVGKAGSGGFVPVASGSGQPFLGQTLYVGFGSGLGGAGGVFLVGANGPASVPMMGGTLLVQPFFVVIPITLGGAAGVPGAGTLSVPWTVYNNPLLVGVRFHAQGMFADPGVSPPLSMSNGVEISIGG